LNVIDHTIAFDICIETCNHNFEIALLEPVYRNIIKRKSDEEQKLRPPLSLEVNTAIFIGSIRNFWGHPSKVKLLDTLNYMHYDSACTMIPNLRVLRRSGVADVRRSNCRQV
jgi:hypothetical protein